MDLSTTLHDLFALVDTSADARPAYRFRVGPKAGHFDLTFSELRDRVARRAGALEQVGCVEGERVAILMPHHAELFVTFLACLYRGFVPSIIAWPTTKMDAEKYRRNVLAVVERLDAAKLVTDADSASRLGASLGGAKVIDPASLRGPESARAEPRPRREAPLFIQFSGGTTGTQKSVPIGARQLEAQLTAYARRLDLSASDVIVSWLPLYHDMGLVACLLLPFLYRLPVTVFAPMEWVIDPRPFLESIGEHRATLCWLPNFAFAFMAQRARASTHVDLSSMRGAINCSEPLRAESIDAFYDAFASSGLRREALQSCYAMAEATFAVTQTSLASVPRRLQVSRAAFGHGSLVESSADARVLVSCGKPIEGIDIAIVDDALAPTPDAHIGEILVKGEAVMDDYLAGPSATPRASFAGDWYKTGDLGAMVDGELFVTGRKKDVIIIGGVNVFPEDVEAAASSVEGIRKGRCVAMGLEEALRGTERLVVAAELAVEGAGTEAIEAGVRAAVTALCGVAPTLVILVPPQWIVKSTAGKISRSETKARVIERWSELAVDLRGAFVLAE